MDNDIEKKINKFQHICKTTNNTLENKVKKDTQFILKMAEPALLTAVNPGLRERDKNYIQSAERSFLRTLEECSTRDHIQNDDICAEF